MHMALVQSKWSNKAISAFPSIKFLEKFVTRNWGTQLWYTRISATVWSLTEACKNVLWKKTLQDCFSTSINSNWCFSGSYLTQKRRWQIGGGRFTLGTYIHMTPKKKVSSPATLHVCSLWYFSSLALLVYFCITYFNNRKIEDHKDVAAKKAIRLIKFYLRSFYISCPNYFPLCLIFSVCPIIEPWQTDTQSGCMAQNSPKHSNP